MKENVSGRSVAGFYLTLRHRDLSRLTLFNQHLNSQEREGEMLVYRLMLCFAIFTDLSLDIPLKPKSTNQKTKSNPTKVCHLTGLFSLFMLFCTLILNKRPIHPNYALLQGVEIYRFWFYQGGERSLRLIRCESLYCCLSVISLLSNNCI